MRPQYSALLLLCGSLLAADDVVLDATFDRGRPGSVPQAWRLQSPEGTSLRVVDATPLGGRGLCVEVADRSSTNTASASCRIPCVWVGEAAFRIRTAQTDQYLTVGVTGAYTWFYRGGIFKYNAGQGDTAYPRPIRYAANKWMTVTLRWNAFKKTIGLSVNGKSLGDKIPYPGAEPAESVYFTSSGSRGRSQPKFWVDRVTVRRLDWQRPDDIRKQRPIKPETPIVIDGKPTAVIVPATKPDLEPLAPLLRDAIHTATGARVPIMPAGDIPSDPAGRAHCIAIGNLESNPLLARLYELRSVRCDRGYPGRGGYVVRTVHDPWAAGRNVIVLGGSDSDGIRAAVAAFLKRIKKGRSLVAPRLLDIKLPAHIDSAISRPNNSRMGHAGWQYYLTGREEFAKKFRDKYVRQTRGRDGIFDDDETSGIVTVQPHLFIYNAYQVWPLIEDSPIFSTSDRTKITGYFLDMVRSKEGVRQGGYRHDLLRQRPRQNHQTHTAMGVYYMARYMGMYYDLPQAQDWLEKSETFFAAHDFNSKPACDSNGHQWGASWADVLKYALMSKRHDVFLTGTAREAADRSTVNTNPLGCYVFTGDMGALGGPAGNVHMPTAYFYGEGKYAYRVSPFRSRGVRSGYMTDLEPREPIDHVGIGRARLAPLYYQVRLRGSSQPVPLHRAFDKLSLRSGFDADAHYALLDGIAGGSHSYDDVNTILELWHRRRALLVTGESLYGHSMKHHNGLVVVKDGEGGKLPMIAELLGAWDLDTVGFVSSRLSDYCGMDWTRHLLWRKDRYLLVLDQLAVREAGDYSLQWYWRTLGEPTLEGRTFQVRQHRRASYSSPKGTQAFRASDIRKPAASSGKSFRYMADVDAFLYRATDAGDFFEIEANVERDGDYRILVGLLKYSDRGIVQLSVDGKPLGDPMDLLADKAKSVQVCPGQAKLRRGNHRFRFAIAAQTKGRKKAYIAVHYIALASADSPAENRVLVPSGDVVTIQCADAVRCSHSSSERMGQLWTRYKHADPILRILRHARAAKLDRGQCLTHASLIYLSTRQQPQALALSRIDERTFAIKGDDGITVAGLSPDSSPPRLFMAGPWGIAATDIRALPKGVGLGRRNGVAAELNLSAKRITCLAEADSTLTLPTGTSVGIGRGRHVMTVPSFDDAARMSRSLTEWRQQARSKGQKAQGRATPLPTLPRQLAKQWEVGTGGAVLDFDAADLDGDGRREIIFGSADGKARLASSDGKVVWTFGTGDAVWAVGTADLDGDGEREVIVGSDDAYVYALDRKGKLLWKHTPPFGHQPWVYWTLRASKIRKIAAGDLNGDGKDEVVLGCGNMRCVALSPDGKQMWEFRTDHGTCTTLAVADLDGDGRAEIIGGKGIFSSNSNGFRLDDAGRRVGYYRNQGWTSIVCSLLLTDLEGDGVREVIFGTDRGENLRLFDAQTGRLRWARCLGDNCEAVAAADLDGDGIKEIIAGSASLYVSAYTAKGDRLWYRTVPDSVTALAAGDLDGDGVPEIAVGSADGTLSVLDANGNPMALSKSPASIREVAILRLERGQHPSVIVAGSDGALTVLRYE